MTRVQRIRSFISGLIMIFSAFLLIYFRTNAYRVILTLVAFSFLMSGIGSLHYYFTMARFMVGGKLSLYKGAILVDFAILTTTLDDVPRIYILLYLIVINAFTGFVEVFDAWQSFKVRSAWKLKLCNGLINLFLVLICLLFIKHTNTAVYIYGCSIIYAGLYKIAAAFRKTTFVYIQ